MARDLKEDFFRLDGAWASFELMTIRQRLGNPNARQTPQTLVQPRRVPLPSGNLLRVPGQLRQADCGL